MQNNNIETSFEKGANLGGNTVSADASARAERWANTFEGMEGPSYINSQDAAVEEGQSNNAAEAVSGYDKNISGSAAILNYGLNGAATQLGVGVVLDGIKKFDESTSTDPIHDLLFSLGIDTKAEFQDLKENQAATDVNKNAYYNTDNAPQTMQRSNEGARKAIEDMQILIRAVEGNDPDYAELRDEARKNNKNVFEQAITNYKVQDLASLFSALSGIKQAAAEKRAQEVEKAA